MYSDLIFQESDAGAGTTRFIGVLPGEGASPEAITAALKCLRAVVQTFGIDFTLVYGGAIGRLSEKSHGQALSDEVIGFCADVFDRDGAVLAGAGGGRFVYDLRKQFGLYSKLSPLRPFSALRDTGCLRPGHLEGVDIIVVRENISGVYQGRWKKEGSGMNRSADHYFEYRESEVRDILGVAAGIAKRRRGRLSVVYKESGLPSISDLWRSCAREICEDFGIEWEMIDVDYAAYRLIAQARDMDVVAAPNLFGDILSDLGALLLGSRGMSYSGNFSKTGGAVYQTNHGAAYNLAGKNRVNPIGQILSLGMLLRESMGLSVQANAIEQAVEYVLSQGYRTPDIATSESQVIGTQELGERIADRISTLEEHVEKAITGISVDRPSA